MRIKKFAASIAIAAALFLGLSTGHVVAFEKNIILATTTSTQDSGLLDALLPVFEKDTGYFVKTIAVGSGQAMAMGMKGEADVLLVHSPAAEEKFMAEGHGIDRRLVMHNDFILVGSPEDPAKVKGLKTAAEALKVISEAGALFVSRGDNSGTHAKEKGLWKGAAVNPEGQKWYQQTGTGMGQTLAVASEKKGYTITDRATFLAQKKNLGLEIVVEGEKNLLNVYHVVGVIPSKSDKINAAGAKAFGDFVVAASTQKLIGEFGVATFGAPLFTPDAGKKEEDLGK